MNDFDKDRVLARIKKMMALANDAAATEGERDNALRMAHATLAKYNLTMAQADAVGVKSEEARLQGGVELREHPWMRTVAAAVGKLFFCHFFYMSRGNNRYTYTFVGKESNVYTAQEMLKYIIKSIDTEGKRWAKGYAGNASGSDWRSFCKGAAHKVYRRCVELQEAATATPTTPGTALVLASVYESERLANLAYLKNAGIILATTANRERMANHTAYAAGREYGSKLGLSNQIGGSRAPSAKAIK